ncbi:arrestin domain-containing protein 2-like isoform X2 [Hippoglossus hippoglossus]|uniref:arrestin domain-containing protein 2-like isoform X2 n=1 Tax=Hippoglossus hippoglossus TaxID=8267 RepID=UPI00148BCBCA|nr:arrestin domain-containing protein 2-like isoform X2 [Hippoglossus hippoglossus]
MSSTVKSLKVTCTPVNERDTFTHGDLVSGQVVLEVVKECQIESLSVKFKGKAEVLWTERYGQTTVVYSSKDKYFSLKLHFIKKDKDDYTLLSSQNGETYSSVVAPGCHTYPFTFQFPYQDLPSSFNGSVGKIVYLLEARLSRSMRLAKKDSTKLNFLARADLNSDSKLLAPQHDSKDKKLKFFNSGSVAMDVHLERTGFFQGEGLKVVANIQNNSAREIKPKYTVYKKHSFFASGKRRVNTRDVFREVGEPIPPNTNEIVTRFLAIPLDVEPSIHNCSIITTEHRLRVCLDVKYATDPEIKFTIVILPAGQGPTWAPPPADSDFGSGFPSEKSGNPELVAWGAAAPQPPTQAFGPPPAYGEHEMYPPMTNYDNKV